MATELEVLYNRSSEPADPNLRPVDIIDKLYVEALVRGNVSHDSLEGSERLRFAKGPEDCIDIMIERPDLDNQGSLRWTFEEGGPQIAAVITAMRTSGAWNIQTDEGVVSTSTLTISVLDTGENVLGIEHKGAVYMDSFSDKGVRSFLARISHE